MILKPIECPNCNTSPEPQEIDLMGAVHMVRCRLCDHTWEIPKDGEVPINDLKLAYCALNRGSFGEAYNAFRAITMAHPEHPEAYFGMELAAHKIVYIDDYETDEYGEIVLSDDKGKNPITTKRPILYSTDNIDSDEDIKESEGYKQAIELSLPDVGKADDYRKRADAIDYIVGKFRTMSKDSSKAYDVFLCTKVTPISKKKNDRASRDSRTAEHALAMYIYENLTGRGYKVFYSEKCIDKNAAGGDYEAHILHALRVSKCMLLICYSKNKKYLSTPWVANEYKRYISFMSSQYSDSGAKRDDSLCIVSDANINSIEGWKGRRQTIINDQNMYANIAAFVSRMCESDGDRARRESEAEARARAEEEREKQRQDKELRDRIAAEVKAGIEAVERAKAEADAKAKAEADKDKQYNKELDTLREKSARLQAELDAIKNQQEKNSKIEAERARAQKLQEDIDALKQQQEDKELAAEQEKTRKAAALARYKPVEHIYKRDGVEYIDFGEYPQDEAGKIGSPIRWRVLNVGGSAIVDGKRQAISHYKQDGYLLLISENILDNVPYNKTYTAVQYKDSLIRKWLNGYFVDKAFGSLSKEQNSAILSNYGIGGNGVFDLKDYGSNSYSYKSDGCADISAGDRVTLLNVAEARLYFGTDKVREGKITDYAFGNNSYGVKELKKSKLYKWNNDNNKSLGCPKGSFLGNSWYWLRNRGASGASYASCVGCGGDVSRDGLAWTATTTSGRAVCGRFCGSQFNLTI